MESALHNLHSRNTSLLISLEISRTVMMRTIVVVLTVEVVQNVLTLAGGPIMTRL